MCIRDRGYGDEAQHYDYGYHHILLCSDLWGQDMIQYSSKYGLSLIHISILAAAFMMGSCSDDFLDKEPSENASEDQSKDLLDKDPTACLLYTSRCV